MLYVAINMLLGDCAKYAGLIFGIAFTSFLVTFAASYFTGFMMRGFSLITENGTADVWVMDPAVNSVVQTTNMPWWALDRVRSVQGVQSVVPLVLGLAEARFSNGRFQPFQLIGLDDVPAMRNGARPAVLRSPDAAAVDPDGTTGKLETPARAADQWPHGAPHLTAPTRELVEGDALLINDRRVRIVGRAEALPRFPPRPLLYTTISEAVRILPPERRRLTFVLATAAPGVAPRDLAARVGRLQSRHRSLVSDQLRGRWRHCSNVHLGHVGGLRGDGCHASGMRTCGSTPCSARWERLRSACSP